MALKYKKKKNKRDLEEEDIDDEEDEDDLEDEEDKDDDDEDEDDEDDDEDEEDDEEEDEEEDDDDDDDEEDENEEDEDEEEEEPVKKKSSRKKSSKTKTKSKTKSKAKAKTKVKSKTKVRATSSKKKKKNKPSFLKRGKARAAAFKKDDVRAKQREEESGKLWRFFISQKKLEEDFQLTFLDGDLDEDGLLENPVYMEHSMKIGGRWRQFVSCQDEEPDPLQEAGKEPYLAQVFTVIDRTEYTDDDGKVHRNRKKLLVAKRKTQKQLLKLAKKRKGLKGCTFTVSRMTDTSVNVGDNWDFDEKMSIKDLRAELVSEGTKKKEVKDLVIPADYDEELTYYTAKELEKMGLVETQSTISQKSANEDEEDIDEDF